MKKNQKPAQYKCLGVTLKSARHTLGSPLWKGSADRIKITLTTNSVATGVWYAELNGSGVDLWARAQSPRLAIRRLEAQVRKLKVNLNRLRVPRAGS